MVAYERECGGIGMWYIGVAVAGAVIIAVIVAIACDKKKKGQNEREGIETEAVVTRVRENAFTDEEGRTTVNTSYYVTFRTMEGKTEEAILRCNENMDMGNRNWNRGLRKGSILRIRYLPEKPNYVVRVGK